MNEVTQIPGLYLGAKPGRAVGLAIAFSILQVIYSIFNYLILIRTLLSPCLHDYIQSMWPALWMSGALAATVLVVGFPIQTTSRLVIFILQIMCGVTVYLVLMVCSQKMLLNEIKSLVFKKNITIDKK